MRRIILLVIGLALTLTSCANKTYYNYKKQKALNYSSMGIEEQVGDLYIPNKQGPHPVVIVIHGGGWKSGHRKQMSSVARRIAKRGMATFNISYRLGPKHKYPLAIQDVKEAIRFVKSQAKKYNLNKDKVGVFGYSAGGHLSLVAGLNNKLSTFEGKTKHPIKDTHVSVVAAGAPPTDLTLFNDNPSTMQWIGKKSENLTKFKQASPYYYISKKTAPTFIYQGKHDWIVDKSHAEKYIQKLNKLGIANEFFEVNFGHIFNFLFDMEEVDKASDYLALHLL